MLMELVEVSNNCVNSFWIIDGFGYFQENRELSKCRKYHKFGWPKFLKLDDQSLIREFGVQSKVVFNRPKLLELMNESWSESLRNDQSYKRSFEVPGADDWSYKGSIEVPGADDQKLIRRIWWRPKSSLVDQSLNFNPTRQNHRSNGWV